MHIQDDLTAAARPVYANSTAPHWAGGFGSPCKQGAEAMRRQVRGFFYAPNFKIGKLPVWNSLWWVAY